VFFRTNAARSISQHNIKDYDWEWDGQSNMETEIEKNAAECDIKHGTPIIAEPFPEGGIAHVTPHASEIGTYIGISLGVCNISGLAGSPISGALIAQHCYRSAIIFTGVVILVGTSFIACAGLLGKGRLAEVKASCQTRGEKQAGEWKQ
jgi:hypothetical protein